MSTYSLIQFNKKSKENITYYVQTCVDCGKQFRVGEGSKETRCQNCRRKLAENKRREQYQTNQERLQREVDFLVGAVITEVNHTDCIGELSSITVRTTNGKILEFTAHGYEDGSHIEWEEHDKN